MPNIEQIETDVVVVGGGNAALCAAMTAREAGAKVLVLESAPKDFRGGNSRHTRNIRYVHNRGDDCLTGPYLEDEFWEDLLQVTGGKTHLQLARLTIRESADLGQWMNAHGCHFQPPLRGTLHLARTNAHFLGGGKALMNAYYAAAGKLGVGIMFGRCKTCPATRPNSALLTGFGAVKLYTPYVFSFVSKYRIASTWS